MMMDDEVEMEVEAEEPVFVVHEVDLDYEYDAPMYFDFGRSEYMAEALAAESWFDSAASCPPSPFVVKLIMRDQMLNVNVSPKSKIMQYDNVDVDTLCCDGDTVAGGHQGAAGRAGALINQQNLATVSTKPPEFRGELRLGHATFQWKTIAQAKSSAKLARPRNSTLMKPTASQLAKQNQSSKVANSRCQIQLGQLSGKGLCNYGVESQAVKRQKLEGGDLCKVFEVQQQAEFVHKASSNTVFEVQPQAEFVHKASSNTDEVVEKSCCTKLRLTIPKEPDLATANRPQRTRSKTILEEEQMDVTLRRFKARPLNRKIFEAPLPPLKKSVPRAPEFQVFHLRTRERAVQHNSATSTTSVHRLNPSQNVLPSCSVTVREQKNSQRLDETDLHHTFKARPLDKKGFKSSNEKKIPQTPPIDLFSKLSINSQLQPSTISRSQTKTPQPSWPTSKGPKENKFRFLPQNNEITTPSAKNKLPPPSGGKQFHLGSEQAAGERYTSFSTRSSSLR